MLVKIKKEKRKTKLGGKEGVGQTRLEVFSAGGFSFKATCVLYYRVCGCPQPLEVYWSTVKLLELIAGLYTDELWRDLTVQRPAKQPGCIQLQLQDEQVKQQQRTVASAFEMPAYRMKAVKNNTLLTSCLGKKKQNTSFNDTLADSGAFITFVVTNESLDGSTGTDCSHLKVAILVVHHHLKQGASLALALSYVIVISNSAGPSSCRADQPKIASDNPGGLRVTSRAMGEGSSIPRPGSGLSTPSLPVSPPPQLMLPTMASQGVSGAYQAFLPLYSLLMQFICLHISLRRHSFFPNSLHFRLYILVFDLLH